jgi:hypothetical protein
MKTFIAVLLPHLETGYYSQFQGDYPETGYSSQFQGLHIFKARAL